MKPVGDMMAEKTVADAAYLVKSARNKKRKHRCMVDKEIL